MPKSWLQWRAPENSGVLLSFCIWFVCCASAKPFPITNISEIISASPGIPTFAFNISDNHNRKNKLHNSKTVFLKPVNDSFENWSVLSPKVTNLGDSMTKYKHWTRITASDVAKLNRLKNQSVTKNLYDYFSYDKISKANNNSAQGESEKKLNIIYSEIEESEKHKFHVDLLEASSFNLSTLKNALYLSRTDRSAPNTKANNSNHLVKFQSQPQIGLINSVSRNNRDPNLERNERSANLSHITGTARKIQLYIKNRFLQLLPDGIVNGTTDEMSDYTILQRTTVNIGQIKIQGIATCLFLCMDTCGAVYGSKEFSDDCIFNENMEEHHYNSYSSSFHSNTRRTMYLALNRHGVIRKIQIPKLRSLGKLATYTKALTQTVVQDRVNALIAKLFGPNHIRHGLKQLCESGLALKELTAANMKRKPKCNSASSIGSIGKLTKKKKKKRKCRDDELDDNLIEKTVINSAKLSYNNNSIINLSKPKPKKFQHNLKTQPKLCIPNGDDQKAAQKKPSKKPNLKPSSNKNYTKSPKKKKNLKPTSIPFSTTPVQNLPDLIVDDDLIDLEHDEKPISSEEDEEWEELEKIGKDVAIEQHNSFVYDDHFELEN